MGCPNAYLPSADRYSVPLGFLTQVPNKLQKMAAFTQSVLVSSLYASSRGNGTTADERRFRFEDAAVSEFAWLDRFTVPRMSTP
jgi:hypothetical protein